MDVFDLSAILRLDSTQYEKGLTDAENKANSFGSKVKSGFSTAVKMGAATVGATVAVAGGFAKAAKSTADYGDNVDKTSQKLGLSAEAYQKWDYVMKIAGTDMSSMGMGLKTLTNKLDDAKNGSSEAQEMFGKLGLSMDELSNMSREEVFEATIKGFQGLEDSTERAALANDLFGRSGQALAPLFNQTAEKTEEQMKLAEKYGMVMPDAAVKASAAFKDSLTTMQMTFTGLKNRLMGEFLPSMTKVTDGLAALFAGDYDEGIEKINSGIEEFVKNMTDILPRVLEIGGSIITSLADAILQNIPKLIPVVTQLFVNFVQYCIEALPQIANVGVQIITSLINSIVESLPQLITVLVDAIIQISTAIVEALPQLIEAFVGAIPVIINALLENIPRLVEAGVQLFTALIQDLPTIIESIIAVLPLIIDSIVGMIPTLLPLIIQSGIQLFTALVQALPEIIEAIIAVIPEIIDSIITALIESIPLLIDAGVELFISLIENLPKIIETIVTALPKIIVAIIETLVKNLPKMIKAGVDLFVALITNLPKIIIELVKAVPKIIVALVKAFGEGIVALADVGIELVKGLWKGIKSAAGWLWDKVAGWLGDLWGGIKSFFGIASPSKEMAWVGQMLSKGLAGGIEDSAKEAVDAAASLTDQIMDAVNPQVDFESSIMGSSSVYGNSGMYSGMNMGGVTFNIYGTDRMNVNDIADAVEERLVQLERQRANAWA